MAKPKTPTYYMMCPYHEKSGVTSINLISDPLPGFEFILVDLTKPSQKSVEEMKAFKEAIKKIKCSYIFYRNGEEFEAYCVYCKTDIKDCVTHKKNNGKV